MGPKNESMIHSNIPTKELSWIDRMYQKLEDICVEVDKNPSLLIQETSKFVESQMNVVGTNVKKICAELIQDLLPPTEKKFDCPIHCKCDCIDLEKPKQKVCYTSTKDTDRPWGSEDINVQETIAQHNKKVTEAERKTEEVTTNHKGMDVTEVSNLTRVKVEEQSTVIECNSIKSKDTNPIQVMKGVIGSDEKKAYVGGSQETKNNSISIDQVATSKHYGKPNAMRKVEHDCSYKSHRGASLKRRLVKKKITPTNKEGSEMNAGKLEEICLENMKAVKEEEAGVWLQDRSKLQEDEFKSTDDLENDLTTCMESNAHNLDAHYLRDNLSLNQMDGYDVTSSSTQSKLAGYEADDLMVTCDYFSTELCETSKAPNSMMISEFVEVDYGDEEQSARWLVSESHRNIFQHDKSFSYSLNTSSNKKDVHVNEFESDWELI